MREQPVVLDRLDRQVHAVTCDVRASPIDQLFDERDHLRHVRRRVRIDGRPLDADRVHRLIPDRLALDRDLLGRPALALAALDDVVVDVGDVRDVANVEARPLEVAPNHVEDEREAAMPQMGRAIDRGTTHVHAHLARLAECELADSAGGGVMKVDHAETVAGGP